MKLLLAYQHEQFAPEFIGRVIDSLRANDIDVLNTLHREAILASNGLSCDDSVRYIDPDVSTCDALLYLQAVDARDGELVPWQFAWAKDHRRPIIIAYSSAVEHMNLVNRAPWQFEWDRPDEIIDFVGGTNFRTGLSFYVPANLQPPHPSRGKRLKPRKTPDQPSPA